MQIGLSTCGKVLDDALFRAYRDAGISMMEISTAAATITRPGELTCRVFSQNAGELFSAAPLTVTGTRRTASPAGNNPPNTAGTPVPAVILSKNPIIVTQLCIPAGGKHPTAASE